jgi:flagellar motility protein MotE (MotC chaperone)
MQLLVNVLCFAFGVVTTIAVLVGWVRYMNLKEAKNFAEIAKKNAEEAQKALDEQQRLAAETLQNSLTELLQRRQKQKATDTELTDTATVKERLRRAVELTAKQSKINVNQGPDFVMQHNELELEKLCVLKSIIADGFDPVITIRFNTGDRDMLLSNYIQSLSKGLA